MKRIFNILFTTVTQTSPKDVLKPKLREADLILI